MSMRLRALILLPLLGVAAFALWLAFLRERPALVERSSPSPATARRASQSAGPSADAELAALRLENVRLRAQLAQVQAGNQAQPAAASSAEAAEPPTPEQEMAWLEARAKFYDDILNKQPRNDAWASAMERQTIESHRHLPIAGVSVVKVACRSSACRMDFKYADEDIRTQHLHALGELFPELPIVSYSYPGEPSDHSRAVLFMTTRKDPLPPFDYARFSEEYRTRNN